MIRSTWLLTYRSLKASIRNPFAYITNFALSLFFLFVWTGGLSGITSLPQLENVHYVAFILPVALISAVIGAASGAGLSVVEDIESGYFSRLILTPVPRLAIILGPAIVSMFQVVIQTIVLLLIGIAMGLRITTGFGDIMILLALSAGWGLAFTGFSLATALITKKSSAVQMCSMIFFPLIFFSTTFVPMELIEVTWMKWAARINPATYVIEGMRSTLIPGNNDSYIVIGLLICGIAAVLMLATSVYSARKVFGRS